MTTFHPESLRSANQMLASWPLLRWLPPALAALGHEVVVLAHAGEKTSLSLAGVRYEFVDPGAVARQAARLLHRWKPRHGPAYYLPASALVSRLRHERPDIVHFSGLTLDLQLAVVSRTCRRMSIPLVVHFHGGLPDRGRLRGLQRRNASRIDRVLVTTREQAEPWVAAGHFMPEQFVEVVESSSPFAWRPRHEARALTGMHGDPVYLSAGRLDAIKDPLTMLRGWEQIAAQQPDARLYLHFLTAEMFGDITTFLARRPTLASRTELRGRAPLELMESVYSSADFLLQASTREWSGLAVIEAMSCGCIPIVSDIPSFRQITGGGRYGRLFPVGDASALANAALAMSSDERARLSAAVHEHFGRALSFQAIARQIDEVYRHLRVDVSNDGVSG